MLEKLTGPLGLPIAVAGAAAGGLGGGAYFLSLSGIIWGVVSVLGALGVLATVSDVTARLTGGSGAAVPATPAAAGSPAAPSGAKAPEPVAEEATETEAELLSQGRFADYHLAKAKRYMSAGDAKQAAYHAGASLAHGDLAEAKQLRRTALGR